MEDNLSGLLCRSGRVGKNMKTCPKCGIEKESSEFYNRSGTRSHQLRSYCRACEKPRSAAASREWRKKNPEKSKDADLRKVYGITLQDKLNMLSSQAKKCAACGASWHGNKRYKDSETGWLVDHDHKTGKIRGLLCDPCNRTIGQAKEDLHRLVSLTAYLTRHLV